MTEPRVIDTVLFDIGNTLLDFEVLDPRLYFDEGFRLGYEYLTSRGYTLPPFGRYSRVVRRAVLWRYLWSRLVRREMRLFEGMIAAHKSLGIVLDHDTAVELAWQSYLPMRRAGVVDPSARAVLQELRSRGYKLGIVSNTATPPTALDRHLQEEGGLLEFFPMRVYSCNIGYMKPHRRIFEIALSRMGSVAAGTMYVGDKVEIDVKGAGRLGMATVLKSPNGTGPRGRRQPDHTVRSLAQLPQVLESYAFSCPSN
ncbi:MAG: HAD family hydrolase [Phycisphaerae bacterium]|nr:HAD family hydrolase [Phycisphaerae bacterium]